jgi:hypothetical protein
MDDGGFMTLPGRCLRSEFREPFRFIVCKILPALIFLLAIPAANFPSLSAFLVLASSIIELWLCKNYFGLALVGLRWSHEITDHGAPRWLFYSRKDPYVPHPVHSAVFWSGILGSCLLWCAYLLWAVFCLNWFQSILCALGFIFQLGDAFCFLRCRSVAAQQADDVARSVVLEGDHDTEVGVKGQPEYIYQ